MHLVIGTPMFAGACSGEFTRSVSKLIRDYARRGDRVTTLYLGNESLIQRARNAIVWLYLQHLGPEEATHLLFWDGDQSARTDDIDRMIAADKDIICAPVPMKGINWKRVADAARAGVPPEELYLYTGIFNVWHTPGSRRFRSDEPIEIERGGSGLMLIKRRVFEALAGIVETYTVDLPGDAIPPGSRLHNFFPVTVANDKLMSEDYAFCNLWKQMGGKIWLAPWAEVVHVGAYNFSGSYKHCYSEPPKLKPLLPTM